MSEQTPDTRPFQEFNSHDAERVAELEQVSQLLHEILQDGRQLSEIRFSLKETAVTAADYYVNSVRDKIRRNPEIYSTEISISGEAITVPVINISPDEAGVQIKIDREAPSRMLDAFEELEASYQGMRYDIRDDDGEYGEDNEDSDGFYVEPEMILGVTNPDNLRLTGDDKLRQKTYLISIITVVKMAYANLSGGINFTLPELEQIRRRYEALGHDRFSETDAQKVISAFQSLDETLKTTDPSKFKYIDDIQDIFSEVHQYSQTSDDLVYPTINALEEVIGRQRLLMIKGQAAVNSGDSESASDLVNIYVQGKIESIVQGNPYTDDKSTIHIVLADNDHTYYVPITKVYSLGY